MATATATTASNLGASQSRALGANNSGNDALPVAHLAMIPSKAEFTAVAAKVLASSVVANTMRWHVFFGECGERAGLLLVFWFLYRGTQFCSFGGIDQLISSAALELPASFQ
jgi:hypothetical protein